MTKFKAWKKSSAMFLLCAVTAIASPAQTPTKIIFKTIASFGGANGVAPGVPLVQGLDGNFYATSGGGPVCNPPGGTCGTVFKLTAGGTLTTLYDFCPHPNCADGDSPTALVQATNGDFYGTTAYGGASNYGTVFKITEGGKLTTLHSFNGADGAFPFAGLVQGTDGNFYGTTSSGGANRYFGIVFRMTPRGAVTTLHSFDNTDGASPLAGLVQGTDGIFYGTTQVGGAGEHGTVFKIDSNGTFTTLHSFDGTDGAYPTTLLVQAAGGSFYGTTDQGGANNCDCGTVFKIDSNGTFTTLHSFDGTDGRDPGGLVQGTDGNMYGTASEGANGNCSDGCGTVFRITPKGELTTLHSFHRTDGGYPSAGLVQATSGSFYGTTILGGPNKDSIGTFFSLSGGLQPFVETLPTSGKIGATVKVLGTDLTGASSVSFHGTEATFKVVSKSEITTDVPSGATTGKVEVKTPHGTLVSNVVFRVKQ